MPDAGTSTALRSERRRLGARVMHGRGHAGFGVQGLGACSILLTLNPKP